MLVPFWDMGTRSDFLLLGYGGILGFLLFIIHPFRERGWLLAFTFWEGEAGFQEDLTSGHSSLCSKGLQQQGLMAFCL